MIFVKICILIRSALEQEREENKKLHLDLSESNARNSLLAREVDERQLHLDKSWESRMM